ncbi:MAG: M48 family metalloprotease [Desulfobulbaceae bacterium]|jgi:Zn-dependent protease with chaperone function|nr:M48 family metalloprotease [Desulfobulbaceae bacterium]
MDLFASEDRASRHIARLALSFFLAALLILAVTNLLVYVARHPTMMIDAAELRGEIIAHLIVSITLFMVMGLASWRRILTLSSGGGDWLAGELGGVFVQPDATERHQRLLNELVAEMAVAADISKPHLYVFPNENGINAMVAGWNEDDTVLCLSQGALYDLTRDELRGVIAHQMSHIRAGDMRRGIRLVGLLSGLLAPSVIGRTIVQRGGLFRPLGYAMVAVGFLGVFCGRLIRRGVTRRSEFFADAQAARLTGNPRDIAGALIKIDNFINGSEMGMARREEVSHMFFADAMPHRTRLLAIHSPISARILALSRHFPIENFFASRDERRGAMAEEEEIDGLIIVEQIKGQAEKSEPSGADSSRNQAAPQEEASAARPEAEKRANADENKNRPAPPAHTEGGSVGATAPKPASAATDKSVLLAAARAEADAINDAANDATNGPPPTTDKDGQKAAPTTAPKPGSAATAVKANQNTPPPASAGVSFRYTGKKFQHRHTLAHAFSGGDAGYAKSRVSLLDEDVGIRFQVPKSVMKEAANCEIALLFSLLQSRRLARQRRAMRVTDDRQAIHDLVGDAVYIQMQRLLPTARTLPQEQVLPTMEWALPRFNLFAKDERLKIVRKLDSLATRDGDISISEYCLTRLARLYLTEQVTRKPSSSQLVKAIIVVFLMIAWQGGSDDEAAARAFHEGIRLLLPKTNPNYVPPKDWVGVLDESLDNLAAMPPTMKQQMVAALLVTVTYDSGATVDELELLRLVTAALNLPMPTFAELRQKVEERTARYLAARESLKRRRSAPRNPA